MNDARVGGAGVGEMLLAQFRLDAAEEVWGEQRTLVYAVHPYFCKTGWLCALRHGQNAGVNQRAKRVCGEFLVLFISGLVDRYSPALTASVLASRTDATKALSVSDAKLRFLGQWALLAAGRRTSAASRDEDCIETRHSADLCLGQCIRKY